MLMTAVVSIAFLGVTVFCLKDKRLNLFELLAIWLTVMAVNAPTYSYFLVNQHWISIPESKEKAVVRIVYTVVLNPLFFTWALDATLVRKRFFVRALCYIAILVIMLMGGWSLHKFGIVHFTRIGFWLYAPMKFIVLISALGAVRLARYLIRKDGIPDDSISAH